MGEKNFPQTPNLLFLPIGAGGQVALRRQGRSGSTTSTIRMILGAGCLVAPGCQAGTAPTASTKNPKRKETGPGKFFSPAFYP
jgi:hypothetical protein